MRITAIDPGPVESAFVTCSFLSGAVEIHDFGKLKNYDLLSKIPQLPGTLVIEMIASYGMPVGAEVFETCVWIGRFVQVGPADFAKPYPWLTERLTRNAVKNHLCGSSKAKDANIRQALIDRFGGSQAIKKGGALHGISGDVWAALAVAMTWGDLHAGGAA